MLDYRRSRYVHSSPPSADTHILVWWNKKPPEGEIQDCATLFLNEQRPVRKLPTFYRPLFKLHHSVRDRLGLSDWPHFAAVKPKMWSQMTWLALKSNLTHRLLLFIVPNHIGHVSFQWLCPPSAKQWSVSDTHRSVLCQSTVPESMDPAGVAQRDSGEVRAHDLQLLLLQSHSCLLDAVTCEK